MSMNRHTLLGDPYYCRSCCEDEKYPFHVIAECPGMHSYRVEIFSTLMPLPNQPDWSVSQVIRFLKETQIGEYLDVD